MLNQITTSLTWAMIGLSYILLLAASFFLGSAVATACAAALLTAGCWSLWWRLSTRDRHHRWLASLTPVVDLSTLQGEAQILRAAAGALNATLRNPNSSVDARLRGVQMVLSAAAPIMGRNSITPQMAVVEGYPAWPEIDRTEMPGQAGDFLSVHLIRIDATISKLAETAAAGLVIEEQIASIAAEVVPPLRAMEDIIAATRPPAGLADPGA